MPEWMLMLFVLCAGTTLLYLNFLAKERIHRILRRILKFGKKAETIGNTHNPKDNQQPT